jgi:hypothetical protein
MTSDGAAKLDSVHFGHHPVGQDDGKETLFEKLKGLSPIGGSNDLVTGLCQAFFQEPPPDGIVFGDKDRKSVLANAGVHVSPVCDPPVGVIVL